MLNLLRVGYFYSLPLAEERMTFAHYMGGLFGIQVEARQAPSYSGWAKWDLVHEVTQGFNLVILQEPVCSTWQRPLAIALMRRFIEGASSSVLVLRRERWPLRRVLLYLEGVEDDYVAVDWVVRLARSSQAEVNVLAIIPSVPAIFRGLARMQTDKSTVMASHSRLGRAMCYAERRLQAENVQSRLQLRQGDFEWEFRSAVSESNSDLIAVAAKAAGRFERWLGGDPLSTLLRWRRCPVLLVKPTSSRSL